MHKAKKLLKNFYLSLLHTKNIKHWSYLTKFANKQLILPLFNNRLLKGYGVSMYQPLYIVIRKHTLRVNRFNFQFIIPSHLPRKLYRHLYSLCKTLIQKSLNSTNNKRIAVRETKKNHMFYIIYDRLHIYIKHNVNSIQIANYPLNLQKEVPNQGSIKDVVPPKVFSHVMKRHTLMTYWLESIQISTTKSSSRFLQYLRYLLPDMRILHKEAPEELSASHRISILDTKLQEKDKIVQAATSPKNQLLGIKGSLQVLKSGLIFKNYNYFSPDFFKKYALQCPNTIILHTSPESSFLVHHYPQSSFLFGHLTCHSDFILKSLSRISPNFKVYAHQENTINIFNFIKHISFYINTIPSEQNLLKPYAWKTNITFFVSSRKEIEQIKKYIKKYIIFLQSHKKKIALSTQTGNSVWRVTYKSFGKDKKLMEYISLFTFTDHKVHIQTGIQNIKDMDKMPGSKNKMLKILTKRVPFFLGIRMQAIYIYLKRSQILKVFMSNFIRYFQYLDMFSISESHDGSSKQLIKFTLDITTQK